MDSVGAGGRLALDRRLADQPQRFHASVARTHERPGRAPALEFLFLASFRHSHGPGTPGLGMAQAATQRRSAGRRACGGGRSMIRRVIINADDFGLSSDENRTIIVAFQQGLISSATLMANMPAFEEACSLAREYGLQGRIGLHFNLTYGKPLSTALRSQPRL